MKDVDNLQNNEIIADGDLKKQEEYDNSSPVKKVVIILGDKMLDSLELSESRNIAKNYEQLYENANKSEATSEDKENFAAAAVLMQNSLKNCLANLNKVNPDSFSKDPNVANLYAAYSENSHAAVKALQESGGDVFTALIKHAHDESEKNKMPWNEEERLKLENSIAKLMYLSYLKYEYEHVSGTEEEKKAWRSEILTELISDKFEENVEKFKENPVCSEVIKHHNDLMKEYKDGKIHQADFPGINATIFQAFHNRADSDYQSIYPLVYNGIRYKSELNGYDPKEVTKVRDAINEIDMMKALYRNVFEGSTGNVPVDIDRDPVFDTLYMKRSSRINGQQINYAKIISDNRKLEEGYKEDIKVRKERLKNDKLNSIKLQGELIGSPVVINYVNEYVNIPKNIQSLEKLMAMEKMSLESINNEYWNRYENDYFKKKKKKISPKDLDKAKKKMGDKAVNNEAEEKIKNIGEYTDSINKLNERRAKVKELLAKDCGIDENKLEDCIYRLDVYKKEMAEYPQKIKRYDEIAEADAKEAYEAKKKEKSRISKEVDDEGGLFEQAQKDNNVQELSRIKAEREKRDEARKKDAVSEFECVIFNGKKCFVARNTADTITRISDEYKTFKTTYKDEADEAKDESIKDNKKQSLYDDNFKKLIQEYEKHDKINNAGFAVTRPDRSNNVIRQFDVEIAPEMAIVETDISSVQVDMGLLKPETEAKVNTYVNDGKNGLDYYISQALVAVEKAAYIFRQGSPEYKAIQDGLKDIKKSLGKKNQDESLIVPKCRKMVAIMDQYIDRKLDERDARILVGEKKRSRRRREAVENARAFINSGIKEYEYKAGVSDKDFTPEEVAYQLEFSAELKKVDDPNVNDIIETLKNGNRLVAQNKMQDYLADKVKTYKKENAGYTFKLKDIDEGNRLPDDKDERMYAMMLKGYEKLVNSNLAYYQYESISELPGLIESIEHYNFKEDIGKSINDVFGVNINTVRKEPNYKLVRTDNALDYARQFDENYKCGLSMLTNDLMRFGMKTNECRPDLFVTEEVQKNLLDNAFSNLYLKSVHENAKTPFNFDEVDNNRRKILTVIHSTPIIENVGKVMKEYFTIKDETKKSPSKMHEILEMKNRMVKEPVSFNKQIVSDAIGMTAKDVLDNVTEMLSQKNYNRDEMSQKLGLLDLTNKIAKEVGMTHVLDKLNKTGNIPFKGTTFADTIKKIQNKVNERNIRKQIAPAKGVKL